MDIITQYYRKVMQSDCVPVTMGGEHTLTYPLLRAVAEKHGPVGLIQVFGEFINPRRACAARVTVVVPCVCE